MPSTAKTPSHIWVIRELDTSKPPKHKWHRENGGYVRYISDTRTDCRRFLRKLRGYKKYSCGKIKLGIYKETVTP